MHIINSIFIGAIFIYEALGLDNELNFNPVEYIYIFSLFKLYK